MPLGRIRRGPARGLLVQRCPRPTGHVGRGPLLCGLAAHCGGSGPRPRGAAHVLGGGNFTDAGGPATRLEWQRLRRSAGGAASSPGRRVRRETVRWPVTWRSAARLGEDLHGNGEGEAAGNRSTRRQDGGEHGGQSGEKMMAWCAHLSGGGEARPSGDGGVARSDTRGRKQEGDGGFGHRLSGRRVRRGRRRTAASKYQRDVRPDSAAHGSQPGHGAGRQCH
jgi:hypothetical protein